MKCDIAIPVWNKKDLTQRCVESILSNTIFPYRIVLIDNASGEVTKKYLRDVSTKNPDRINLVTNEKNLGNTAAGSQGMRFSDAEYVCILDNDTIVCKGWLSEMVKAAESSECIGIVNPQSNSFGLSKKKLQSLEDFASDLLTKNSGRHVELGSAIGFCYMVKRKVINEIGYWDERFSPGYFEDTEYSMRAKKKGYKSVVALGAYVYHDEHASFKSKDKKKEFEKLFKASQDKFHAMYGKPKRILYVVSEEDKRFFELLKRDAYREAEKGNWVSVLMKDNVGDIELARHGNIRKIASGGFLFDWKVLIGVITKKKKYNEIFSNDRRLLRKFMFFKRLHKADVKRFGESDGE